ncbi:MAG TPA: carbohydrate ABC transporter permease [Chloroflexi bacterium]|nr:carbohydrate ABC transporter permease [Chloroflexota bacterium]
MYGIRRQPFLRVALAGLIVVILFSIYAPLAWLAISSVSTRAELLSKPPHWIPRKPTLEHYANILTTRPDAPDTARVFRRALLNSFIVSSSVTMISLLAGIPAAYAFARINFKGRRGAMLSILGTRMLPAISIVIPLYMIAARLGVVDTRTVLVVLYLTFTLPFVIWIMASFFQTIPLELEDAARIDGCTRLGTLWRVILPISGPGLASTIIFAFLLAWDEFFFALIFTSTEAAKTVPLAIAEFTGRYTVDYGAMTTGGVLAAIPPILIALLFQRYIVSGLTAGAVK